MKRDCETCIHARPYGGKNDNRCTAWSCEYINRAEAIEAWETLKAMREARPTATSSTEVPWWKGE